MTQLIVDENIHTKLLNLPGPVELCDATGRVIARVRPVLDPALYENLYGPPISKEELDRRYQEVKDGKFCTFDEVMAYLEKL